ncbi:triphosphoribosyl-dephospho-CoA synthase [Saccharococcus caldoxylosilyticus]|uniref:triphosphoribosyl-dephospho-CoA synthase n=1 Tax=Saccharococcus caldoxylosilyticus TaxID=81408 RepID=UPI0002F81F3D|nr:triphosphoribosyl-dephospho-CoA synthase [Parageobacillus caldoxylosilyticus]
MIWNDAIQCSHYLSQLAVAALIEEAELTPKPGLVDQQNSGAHTDLTLEMMIRSAQALQTTFANIAYIAFQREPSQQLREEIAKIGRCGEKVMFETTGGINTHKGAIWALGLLVASAAMHKPGTPSKEIASTAGRIASYPDRYAPQQMSNGLKVQQRYGVPGARGEAQQGFPHVIHIALPTLHKARQNNIPETLARIDALISLIAYLDDTCILHRGGMEALITAKKLAKAIISVGGVSTSEGWNGLLQLDQELLTRNASPGGSADLLAAALFLDRLYQETANQSNKCVTMTM